MPLSLSILAFSAALAGILGFAAHRANICTVKAVEEILTTRRAYMLLSFGKTVLWVILVTLVLSWTVSPALVVNWKVLTCWSTSKGPPGQAISSRFSQRGVRSERPDEVKECGGQPI